MRQGGGCTMLSPHRPDEHRAPRCTLLQDGEHLIISRCGEFDQAQGHRLRAGWRPDVSRRAIARARSTGPTGAHRRPGGVLLTVGCVPRPGWRGVVRGAFRATSATSCPGISRAAWACRSPAAWCWPPTRTTFSRSSSAPAFTARAVPSTPNATSSPSMDISRAPRTSSASCSDPVGRDPAAWRRCGPTWRYGASTCRRSSRSSKPATGSLVGASSHADRLQTIRNTFDETGVLVDPHTAEESRWRASSSSRACPCWCSRRPCRPVRGNHRGGLGRTVPPPADLTTSTAPA